MPTVPTVVSVATRAGFAPVIAAWPDLSRLQVARGILLLTSTPNPFVTRGLTPVPNELKEGSHAQLVSIPGNTAVMFNDDVELRKTVNRLFLDTVALAI
jgi:hypothetical protein